MTNQIKLTTARLCGVIAKDNNTYIMFISSNTEEHLYKQSNVEHDSSVTGFRQKVYTYLQHSNTYKVKKKGNKTYFSI